MTKVSKAAKKVPGAGASAALKNIVRPGTLTARVVPPKRKRDWYEWLTPVQGIKWGATVTLVGYTVAERRDSEGLMFAAAIVTFFMFLEWTTSAYKEFRRAK